MGHRPAETGLEHHYIQQLKVMECISFSILQMTAVFKSYNYLHPEFYDWDNLWERRGGSMVNGVQWNGMGMG